MTPQTGQQMITIHILPSISKSKGNRAIKVGQLIKYSMKIFFFKDLAGNVIGRLVPDLFLVFKKVLYKVKVSGQKLSFDIFW